MAQLGRFTLRDEGKTIAVGKVLKYKPAASTVAAAGVKKEEVKSESTPKPTSGTATTTSVRQDLIFDMDSGEMLTPEENAKRKREREK
jgi:hypothetical protein